MVTNSRGFRPTWPSRIPALPVTTLIPPAQGRISERVMSWGPLSCVSTNRSCIERKENLVGGAICYERKDRISFLRGGDSALAERVGLRPAWFPDPFAEQALPSSEV